MPLELMSPGQGTDAAGLCRMGDGREERASEMKIIHQEQPKQSKGHPLSPLDLLTIINVKVSGALLACCRFCGSVPVLLDESENSARIRALKVWNRASSGSFGGCLSSLLGATLGLFGRLGFCCSSVLR